MWGLVKFLLWFIGSIVTIGVCVVAAFTFSVKPGVYVIGKMFDEPVTVTDKDHYELAVSQIHKLADNTYDSSYKNNIFDIYYPAEGEEPFPILFWMHGGGFVAGDKEGVEEFATYIAANNKVAVVAMNYDKAPNLQYPGQVFQLDGLYRHLFASQEEYSMLDFTRVFLGGDSAGAQIAGQYVATQTNEAYADEMDIEQILPVENLRGFISYSGPVDLPQMAEIKSDDRFMKFFVNTVARALIGTRSWKDSAEIQQASVKKYVTKDFPPTYITDGNAFSFQEQGLAFAEKLRSLGIPVDSLFFNDVDKEIVHEYQFDYTLDEARESLQQTIDFIDRNS